MMAAAAPTQSEKLCQGSGSGAGFQNSAKRWEIAIFGDSYTGKTALVGQFLNHAWVDDSPTFVEDYYEKQVKINGHVGILGILDTTGQEDYCAIREQYMYASEGFILVYSVTDQSSFKVVQSFIRRIERVKDCNKFPMVLVGNKADLENYRTVSTEEGELLAKQFNCPFFETSAFLGKNVDKIFIEIVRCIRKKENFDNFGRNFDKFNHAYKHYIKSKDVLELLCLKFMFLGPPRFGKSTTRRRVMKEIVDLNSAEEAEQIHGSTGAVECCPNMLVKNTSDSSSTTESGADWTIAQSLTDEACLLFYSLKDSLETAPAFKRLPQLLPKMLAKVKSLTKIKQSRPQHSSTASPTHVRPAPDSKNSSKYSEIATIFQEVSQQPYFAYEVKHSFKAYLRMEDTGGQPELMDMLPALTIGPGLYLLFFSYEFKLDEEYQVFYQRNSGETTVPEKSEFTLQEMLLCMLASISCCSKASTHFQSLTKKGKSEIDEICESSKSVVYIVGTHKDKVSEEYIAMVDKQLQKIIRDTDFYRNGIVQFCSEDKLVISLDNMGGGIEEISQLHRLLESAMEKHFKKLKIPAVWLLFSLCLRMREVRTASMDTCLELSKAFKMTPHETKVALWFLHHHAGVMMYFPHVSGLENLVIIDIQVVYDSITSVILKAMSFESAGQAAAERFRKTGRFIVKDLKSATSDISGDLIPHDQLVALLEYLNILAQIRSDETSGNLVSEEREYIMPCVLENTSLKELSVFHKESSKSCVAVPLFVYFTCGFTPMGLFSAVMACLISNKSFVLVREGIKKNMVQFLYGSNLIRVTFISRSTYYEVVVSCDPTVRVSIHLECAALRTEIVDTLKQASSRMNYSSYMDYQFAFECCSHKGEYHLGVIPGAESVPKVMKCLLSPDNPQGVVLQNKQLIWYGQEYEHPPDSIPDASESGNYLSVFLSVYPALVISVKPCVMTVADHCFSNGLISEDIYDQLTQRGDWINTDKVRALLSNIRTLLSSTPTALNKFVNVLDQVEYCNEVAG